MEFIEENLLPCPCCGSKVKYFPMSHRINNMYSRNTIICPKCELKMENTSNLKLFMAWNTRKPIEQIIEKLREEANECYYDVWENTDMDNYEVGRERGYDNSIDIILETLKPKYTGYKDCEGKPIYIGDIVEEGCNGLKTKVVWNKDRNSFWLEGLGEGYSIENADVEWTVIESYRDKEEE